MRIVSRCTIIIVVGRLNPAVSLEDASRSCQIPSKTEVGVLKFFTLVEYHRGHIE